MWMPATHRIKKAIQWSTPGRSSARRLLPTPPAASIADWKKPKEEDILRLEEVRRSPPQVPTPRAEEKQSKARLIAINMLSNARLI